VRFDEPGIEIESQPDGLRAMIAAERPNHDLPSARDLHRNRVGPPPDQPAIGPFSKQVAGSPATASPARACTKVVRTSSLRQ
jgi:hypothetical protein